MPVNDARRFIHSISKNRELRSSLNRSGSSREIQTLLGENGFQFNSVEFDEAWTSEVAKSPTRECHEEFNELRLWWELLNDNYGA